MYLDYFGFDESPFSITPNPKFVFLSNKHEESLAHLVYGITHGGGAGFVQLTGEVGTGKTTISRLLLEKIPAKTNIALILNPTITPLELIQNICKELKVSMRGIKTKLNSLIEKLNNYLLESWSQGESTVVIIDEAQNLPRDTLEQLRLLTNLETNTHKLLQIILIGQPELRATMLRNDLRQLAQRITARYHLLPLDIGETYDYLQHRIKIAGGNSEIVTQSIAKIIHKITGGVPRLINILTDRALLAAYTDNKKQLHPKHIKIAALEVMPETRQATVKHNWWLTIVTIVTIVVLVVAAYFLFAYINKHDDDVMVSPIEKFPEIKAQKSFTPALMHASWQYYLQLWEAQIDKKWNKPQCPNNVDTGMACLRRQGNLQQIKKTNRPVMLQLENGNLVLLSAIKHDKMALLASNNELEFIKQKQITQQWLGTYFIIWPMPAELLTEPTAKQLSTWALAMANTIAPDKITASQLENWIKQFQNTHGLQADGIIGTETQMTLSLMAYNGPTIN